MRTLVRLVACILAISRAAASDVEHARVPSDVRDLAHKADQALQAQHYEEAAAAYQAIADKHPDSLYAWSKLGVVRTQQDRLDDAVHAFKQAAKLDPNDCFAQSKLGECLFEQRKYSAAIRPLERAEQLNPDNSNTHAMLARCYQKVGRDDDAARESGTESQQRPNMVE